MSGRVSPAVSTQGTVGSRATVRAASEWSEGAARAIAYVRRPDAVKAEMNRRGTPLASLFGLPETLRRAPEGATAQLPPSMLLLIDSTDTLRLFAADQKLHLHLGEEVASWRAGSARLAILPGRGNFRALEIEWDADRITLAAPWRGKAAQAALGLIERTINGPAI